MPVCCFEPVALAVCCFGLELVALAACCFGLELVALAACCFGLELVALAACCFGLELVALAACCFGFELVALRVFDGAAISVLLPAAAARGRLAVPAVSGKFPELLPSRLYHALGLVLCAALLHAADQLRQALLVMGDVKPVDGLREP